MCSKNCDAASTTYNLNNNTCSCKVGYNSLELSGSTFKCTAECDSTSTEKTSNTCSCKTGY